MRHIFQASIYVNMHSGGATVVFNIGNMDFFLGEEDSIISCGRKGPRLNCQGTARCWRQH